MEGEEFLAINPDTLNDTNIWSYRDLQKISKALNIKANDKRHILINHLQQWHRMRVDGTRTILTDDNDITSEAIDMNVIGNNFSLFAMNVKAKDHSTSDNNPTTTTDDITNAGNTHKRRKTCRDSIVAIGAGESGLISPTLLRPLRPEPATPGKSCLKSTSAYVSYTPLNHDTITNTTTNNENNHENAPPSARKRFANICFSPFNGVRVIAHRETIMSSDSESGPEHDTGATDVSIVIEDSIEEL